VTTTPSRTSAAVLAAFLLVSLLATACGGGGGGGGGGAASPTPSPTAGGGAASSDPSASGQASGAVASPAASEGGGSGSSGAKSPPDDACSVVSDTDIKDIFGGDVELVPNDDDEDNSCSFSVTNANGLVEDYAATTPQIVSITFDEGWISYAEEKAAMGDAVDQVDGLGSEAWIGLGAIHVDLGEDNEMVTTTIFGAIYDPTVIEGERYALTKLVLSRL
jgi:hypothetical protein